MRVDQFRELGEDFHHLVGTLAAGRHHDDFGIALLGDGVLEHGLAAAERSGNEARTAFRDGVEGVDDAHARFHDAAGARFFLIALDGHLDRPFLPHADRDFFSLFVHQDGYFLVDVVLSGGCDGLDGEFALEGEGDHDFVGQPAFLDFAQPVCGHDLVAGGGDGREVPELGVVQRVGVFAALEEDILHGGEVVQEAVIDAGQQAGSQGSLQHPALELDFVAVLQAARAFEYLHRCVLARHLDDLRHEGGVFQGDVADLVFGNRAVHTDGHEVGNDSGYDTSGFHISFIFIVHCNVRP